MAFTAPPFDRLGTPPGASILGPAGPASSHQRRVCPRRYFRQNHSSGCESSTSAPPRGYSPSPARPTSRDSTTWERVRTTNPFRCRSMISRSSAALSSVRTRAIASASPVTLHASTTSGWLAQRLRHLVERRPRPVEELDQRLGVPAHRPVVDDRREPLQGAPLPQPVDPPLHRGRREAHAAQRCRRRCAARPRPAAKESCDPRRPFVRLLRDSPLNRH